MVAHNDFTFEHQERHAERVLIFPRFVRQGLSKHTVFVRSLLAGTYQMPNVAKLRAVARMWVVASTMMAGGTRRSHVPGS